MDTQSPPLIYGKIASCLAEIEAVGKTHRNPQQGYNFRSLDDFYDAAQPVLAKHRVFLAPTILSHVREERTTKSGGVMMTTLTHVRFKFFAEDGSYIEADQLGEGADSGDKSANKAASQALKYVLQQVFCVRVTGENYDAEQESPQYTAPAKSAAPAKSTTNGGSKQYELKPAEPIKPTEKTRTWMLGQLSQFGDRLHEYSQAKFACSPDGWPLEKVPTSKAALGELVRDIETFLGEKPQPETSPIGDKRKTEDHWIDKNVVGEKTSPIGDKFWDAVIVIPRAGTKRDDYMKAPDTIKSLYDQMKAGDAKARTRLWGIANEWEPGPRVVDGTEYPPSAAEMECRRQLDLFKAWHEAKQ
jgi:hypothetical protein